MKTIKTLGLVAGLAVLLAGTWIAPRAQGEFESGNCLICTWIEIPDPGGGGGPIIDHACLSLGDDVGYQRCYECINCMDCFMMWECYWSWP